MKGERIAQGRTAEVFAWGQQGEFVLKLFRAGCSLGSVEYEFRIAQAVYEAGIAAPKAEALVEVEGRHGIVYARVQGPTMLAVIWQQLAQLDQFAQQLADIHFELNQKRTTALEPQRQRMQRLIEQVTTLEVAEKAMLLQALAALPDDDAVCHGDLHPDNIMLTPDGAHVIDWNNAVSGNAVADVCWTLLLLERGGLPAEDATAEDRHMRELRQHMRDAYFARYAEHRPSLTTQWQDWYPIVAACRLSDEIAEEQVALLNIVRHSLKTRLP